MLIFFEYGIDLGIITGWHVKGDGFVVLWNATLVNYIMIAVTNDSSGISLSFPFHFSIPHWLNILKISRRNYFNRQYFASKDIGSMYFQMSAQKFMELYHSSAINLAPAL